MTQEQIIRDRIEQTLRRAWNSVAPVEQAINATLKFRSELHEEHLEFFDALILEGVLPENAAQTLQYAIEPGVLTECEPYFSARGSVEPSRAAHRSRAAA
jgi:hypothetical protein